MEEDDFGLFGILDGHGGPDVPKFCVKSIPEVDYQFKNETRPLTNSIGISRRTLRNYFK